MPNPSPKRLDSQTSHLNPKPKRLGDFKRHRAPRIATKASTAVDRALAAGFDEPSVGINWPHVIRQHLDQLTPKQRHFAICRAAGLSQTEAYKSAYTTLPDTLHRTIMRSALTVDQVPYVSATVVLLRDWLEKEWLMDSKEAVEYGMARLYEEAEYGETSADRIRAASALLKAHGAFVSRSEVKHIHTVDSPMADLIEGLSSMLGLAQPVPKTIPQIEAADVASVEFVEPE